MRKHRNPAAESYASRKRDWFYNFCIRLLLERISVWCEHRSVKDFGEPRHVKLIFSKRGGVHYGHVSTYIDLLMRQSREERLVLMKRSLAYDVLDHRLILVDQHDKNAGLQIADVVASSFYQAAHSVGSTTWDPKPAMALKPRMASERGVYADFGVCLQPSPPWRARLTPEQQQIFRYYGYTF